MRNDEAIRDRIAKLVTLRDGMHHAETADRLAFQITELQWVLEQMEDSGGGVLLPANEAVWTAPMDLVDHEHQIEDTVRKITDYVYHESGHIGSHEVQSFIIARVAQTLVQSMVIERQTEVVKLQLFGKVKHNGKG